MIACDPVCTSYPLKYADAMDSSRTNRESSSLKDPGYVWKFKAAHDV